MVSMDLSQALGSSQNKLLRAIWRTKIHTEPDAIEASPLAARHAYQSIWQPSARLIETLDALPNGLLARWADSERGHVVLTHRPSAYRPGKQSWRQDTLESICYLGLDDLIHLNVCPALPLFYLIDHLLGSDCMEKGGWLSDGMGIDESLRAVGERFVAIERLAYGHEELGARCRHDYFAHTLWLALHDRRRLNVLDPLVEKLYASTLLDAHFWERA